MDFGLFSNLRFFCSFLNQLHNSVLGVEAEGRGVALGGGGNGARSAPADPSSPRNPTTQRRPPPPGPWRVWVCVCVRACRVRVQGARQGREACVCACRLLLRVCGDGHAQCACLCVSAEVPAAWALAEPTPGLPEGRGPPMCRLGVRGEVRQGF